MSEVVVFESAGHPVDLVGVQAMVNGDVAPRR
jgi:hypothetical protein